VVPSSKETALPASEPFSASIATSQSTGKAALKQLFEAGAVQRIGSGKGCSGAPFRYYKALTLTVEKHSKKREGYPP
jgi:hypothetical protein